jgi:hypothetical protein
MVGVGAAGLAGLLTWRWRRSRLDAARAVPPVRGAVYPLHGAARAVQPLPPQRAAVERPCTASEHDAETVTCSLAG